ncbi:metalloregulator ArsR/SmtB family transcription factor [bacterium]|nr:metalloregulator ArsR/SmtB family transcription factor [bacterium]MCI0601447.1 metalloregulator ArsR/SmtB family transcription factor [bacterium]
MINIKSRFEFVVSPCFEPFFALQTLTDENSRIHEGWKRLALQRIPQSFHRKFALIGGSPYLWPAVSDTLLDAPLDLSFENRIRRIAKLTVQELQKTIFFGIFHEWGPVASLLSGRYDLFQTVMRISKTKREWLAFIGLYPAKKSSPIFLGLNCLLRTPKEFQKILVNLLEIFWETDFKQTWDFLSAQLERSREEKERLFQSCTLEEFARLALLRVQIDERRGFLEAVRGGYKLPLKKLSGAVILPSAFNDKRHWTTYEGDPSRILAFFPYFDPAISLSQATSGPPEIQVDEPERDPALIFKALGDTTRYAMVALLARDPLTSADLAKAIALSRPTVSHHIQVLREAGLLEEKLQGNAVLLSLRREVFETLSDLVTQKLFHSEETIDLKKTRTK